MTQEASDEWDHIFGSGTMRWLTAAGEAVFLASRDSEVLPYSNGRHAVAQRVPIPPDMFHLLSREESRRVIVPSHDKGERRSVQGGGDQS